MIQLLPTTHLAPSQLLDHLERRRLDTLALPPAALRDRLDALAWRRIAGVARPRQPHDRAALAEMMGDLLAGLHGGAPTTALLLHTFAGELQVLVGCEPEHAGMLETMLRGCLPGVLLQPAAAQVGSELQARRAFDSGGQITGVPAPKLAGHPPGATAGDGAAQIDRLIRGMGSTPWGYVVCAAPVGPAEVQRLMSQAIELIRHYEEPASARLRSGGSSLPGDREAARGVRALDLLLGRLERGQALGVWSVEASYFAADASAAARLAGLLRATFGGGDAQPEPLRVRPYDNGAPPVESGWRQTLLHSQELALLAQIPAAEAPGYQLRDHATFDVALEPSDVPADELIEIGEVLDGDTPTGQRYALPRAQLARHGLLAGSPGSGTTNTCLGIVARVWDQGRGQPFLVIEPSRAEYRALRAAIPDLRVYTAGDERCAPLRLNPFAFEVDDGEHRIHVQAHIDTLLGLFGAAFALPGPQLAVLEASMRRIYEDRGWSLTSGVVERRLPAVAGAEAAHPVFPTLAELQRAIDPAVDQLGYDERAGQALKAELKARIGSLLAGGRGLMLGSRHSTPIADLLGRPAVIELAHSGDDAEKAFVLGLLLTRVSQHRAIETRRAPASAFPLRHLLLIEEAHRLFQHLPPTLDGRGDDARGRAVAMLTGMLAELRGRGQGVLLATSAVARLAPDAARCAGLKIMHRTVAADERRTVGGLMNLDDAQERVVASLPTGQAALFVDGTDRPHRVQIARAAVAAGERPSDAAVREAMVRLDAFDERIYQPRPGCEHCGLWRHNPRRCAMVRARARAAQDQPSFGALYRRYTRSIADAPAEAVHGYPAVLAQVRQATNLAEEQDQRDVPLCALIHASGDHMDELGRAMAIPYPALGALHQALLAAVVPAATSLHARHAPLSELLRATGDPARRYGQLLRAVTTRQVGPLSGCALCSHRCHYGADIAPHARDTDVQRQVLLVLEHHEEDSALWLRLAAVGREVAEQAVGTATPAAAICFTAHVGDALQLSEESQRKLVRNVRSVLFAGAGGYHERS